MIQASRQRAPARLLRSGLAALAAAVLGACTNMTQVPPGTSLAEVQAEYGPPNYSCPEPGGGQRLIWSGQPYGQYAWGTRVDSAGRIDRIDSLLTDEHFDLLKQGTWTPEKVRCEFGPPANIETVGLPAVRQIVWSYRYRQARTWNSLMYVYFGQDGERVTRFHPGPDPLYEERDRWFF